MWCEGGGYSLSWMFIIDLDQWVFSHVYIHRCVDMRAEHVRVCIRTFILCRTLCTPIVMVLYLRNTCLLGYADIPESLLKLVQDISMQLTFCNVDLAMVADQSVSALLPSTSKNCMYPEKTYVSALCQSQFLVGQRSQNFGLFGRQHTCFKPSTESNSGVCCACMRV